MAAQHAQPPAAAAAAAAAPRAGELLRFCPLQV
jgi:hypothetical protein